MVEVLLLFDSGFMPVQQKKAACNSRPATNQEWIDSGCRLTTLLPDCFLVSFRGEFFGHRFPEIFSIHSVIVWRRP